MRADGEHVLADRPQMRHGAQPAHDAANAQRVGNRLAQAEFLRHLEIGHRARFVPADLEGYYNEIGALQRPALVAMGLDLRANAKARNELARDELGFGEPLRIDVHQREGGIGKRGMLQRVADDVLHEHRRTGTDEGYAWGIHVRKSIPWWRRASARR